MGPNVIWVSEDPQMWFSWAEEKGFRGELTIGQKTWPVSVGFRGGVVEVFYVDLSDRDLSKVLFNGNFTVEEEYFEIDTNWDNADLFKGELPTIKFAKEDKKTQTQADTGTVLLS